MSSLSALNSLLGSSSSTSDINLSAILEAAMGASTPGIDVNEAVSASVTAAEAPEQAWESQISTLESQTSALTTIQTDATNLDNDMQALNSLTGPLSAATVTSSNSGLVTATASSGSTAGNTVVEVNSLATADSWSSNAVASDTADLPAESITITGASGTAQTFTTGGSIETLSDLEGAINSAGLGVTASIITDTTGSRLALTSDTTGSASDFTVSTSGGSFGFTEVPGGGTNASLIVNGISVSSASNTVTGVVPGVTLSLLSASPGTQVTLTTSPNTAAASTAINQFVSDYNTLITAVNAQYSDTGSGEGVLADDPTVSSLQSDLMQAMDYTATPATGETATTMPNLSSMGITMNSDGTLSVDSTTLDTALQNNYSDVVNFFQGSSLNGFANSMDQQLTSFISPADGAFTVDLQSMSTEQSTLETDITNFQTNVITPLQAQLQTQYSDAEVALQQLPGEIKDVDEELGINNSSSSS